MAEPSGSQLAVSLRTYRGRSELRGAEGELDALSGDGALPATEGAVAPSLGMRSNRTRGSHARQSSAGSARYAGPLQKDPSPAPPSAGLLPVVSSVKSRWGLRPPPVRLTFGP